MGNRRSVFAVLAMLCVSCALALVWSQVALAVEAPVVEDESVANVSATAATLQATANPHASPATYRFEYGTSSAYGSVAPQTEGEIAASAQGTSVSIHVQGLAPATTYHYRVLVTGPGGGAEGSDLTFTTETAGEELVLPDGRQWELVSPPNKHGSLIEAGRTEGGMIQAAADGNGIAYYASAPVTGEEAGSRTPEQTSVLSRRGAGGWSTEDLSVEHDEGNGLALYKGTEYKAFSSDLSRGLLEPYDFLKLSPETTEWTPYLRDNNGGSLQPVLTASNVSTGAEFGRPAEAVGYWNADVFEAGNDELTHLVLRSEVPLTEDAPTYGLYEWFDGRLQLISVLPGAEQKSASGGHNSLYVGDGENNQDGRDIHAVSDDGSRIVFVGGEEATDPIHSDHLFLRDIALKQTLRLDSGGENYVRFWAANPDDTKIFFTSYAQLTVGATANNLYECQVKVVSENLTCEMSDLSGGIEVEGVIGASNDGSYVYFVENHSNGSIYVAHEGVTSFIAAIGELPEFGGIYFNKPDHMTLRVSPNGRYLAFMSSLELTGYDNRDAVSGERDSEVYLYDAIAKALTCASCNRTGSRPQGVQIKNYLGIPTQPIESRGTYIDGSWLSGSLPGWINNSGIAFHQPRYLDDSGQLFFNSTEALSSQDVNGLEDVYEYEPDGAGGCRTAAGCVGLVSSGSSQEDAIFMDASESGGDAFFLTAQPLVAKDGDSAFDMYDAHAAPPKFHVHANRPRLRPANPATLAKARRPRSRPYSVRRQARPSPVPET